VLEAVPPTNISTPRTDAEMVMPPELTANTPPLEMVALVSAPPVLTCSLPPLSIVVAIALPPLETKRPPAPEVWRCY